MTGLVGEYLKAIGECDYLAAKFCGKCNNLFTNCCCTVVVGKHSVGCAVLRHVSPNIELEEGAMKMDKETSKEQYYTEVMASIL